MIFLSEIPVILVFFHVMYHKLVSLSFSVLMRLFIWCQLIVINRSLFLGLILIIYLVIMLRDCNGVSNSRQGK